jgi:hypothetical protein
MDKTTDKRTLLDAYRVQGFRTRARVDGYDHDHPAFVITLHRRQKKRYAAAAARAAANVTIGAGIVPVTLIVAITKCISIFSFTA